MTYLQCTVRDIEHDLLHRTNGRRYQSLNQL